MRSKMNLTLDKIKETVKLIGDIPDKKECPLKVFESVRLTKSKQVRFPISKKKRIRKKWTKNLKNWIVYPDPNYYRFGNQIFCHPSMAVILRQEFERGKNDDQR